MTTTVRAAFLHQYNEATNADKYYRVLLYNESNGWVAVAHYGRDGQDGVTITMARTPNYASAVHAYEAKVRSKTTGKGRYQLIGKGNTTFAGTFTGSEQDILQVSARTMERLGVYTVKAPGGMFVIREEETLEDLIA